MANSSFETFKEGGKAIDDMAEKAGDKAAGAYDQAKRAASGAYDSAAEMAQDTVSKVQDSAAQLDDIVTEQVGRHPKAMVALGVGLGFALGVLFASSRTREPTWRDYARDCAPRWVKLQARRAAVGARGSCTPSSVPFGCSTTAPAWPIVSE